MTNARKGRLMLWGVLPVAMIALALSTSTGGALAGNATGGSTGNPATTAPSAGAQVLNRYGLAAQPYRGSVLATAPLEGAFIELVDPSGGTYCNGCTVDASQNPNTFILELWVNGGPADLTAQQTYMTFTNSILNVVTTANLSGCQLSTTVTRDPIGFDTELQNQVCNYGPECTGQITPLPGRLAYASGAFANPPQAAPFRVAEIGLCAIANGTATINFEFTQGTPPSGCPTGTSPANRNTRITSQASGVVSDCSKFTNYSLTFVNVPPGKPPATFTATPTRTATNTRTPTRTRTPTPGGASPTNTVGATNTPVNTATNTPVNTATNTPVNTNTNTPVNTNTNTPVNTATNTPVNTNTPPPGATNTNTPVNTNTNTPVNTNTNTPVNTATNTPVNTATNTPVNTNTNTPVNTNTPPPGATNTNTPVNTNTNTPVNTATNTPVNTNTNTPVNTNTPPPGATNTNTPVNTNTNTPVNTATNTPVNTNTNTPVNTNTPPPGATNTNTPVNTATRTATAMVSPSPTETCEPVPEPGPNRVPICHATGSSPSPYVLMIVSEQGAENHAQNHPNDIVPAPPCGCPGTLVTPTPTPPSAQNAKSAGKAGYWRYYMR